MNDGLKQPAPASADASENTSTGRVAFTFAATTIIWGSTWLAISLGNDTLPPVWAAALRLGIAALVMAGLTPLMRQSLPRGRALAHAVGFGVFQFGIGFPLIYWGETRVASGLTAVLFATVPLTSSLLARVMNIERLSRNRMIGALVSIAGIAVIFSGELSAQTSASSPGLSAQTSASSPGLSAQTSASSPGLAGHTPLLPLLAVILATLCAVTGTMIFKKGPRQNVIPANVVACGVAALVCLAISTIAGEPHPWPHGARAVLPVLYLAIAGSVGAFVMWTWLVSRMSVTRLSFMAVITPLIAIALGALVHHERLAPMTLAGGVVVLAGVAIGMRPTPGATH